ncbi:MAG TPA: phosphate ABC transporter substrate-binding protein PstS [Micromonosporaceae bacterium]
MNRTALSRGILAALAVAALSIAGCANDPASPSPSGSSGASEYADLSGELKASGASFPNNFYQAAIDKFADVAPDLSVTYNSVGSGTGKKEFGAGLTDFAGSDSKVKDGDGPAPGSYYYLPTVAAPITVSYNLSGVTKLQLSPETLGKIFGRTIKNWNDPAIAADNPGVTLPNKAITVVHRSDGSGTTNNFTKYLVAAAGPAWTLGSGDTVNWAPDTQAGEKNTGVAQLVKQSDGAIGYIDFADATASGLAFAAIKNKDGNYVAASLEGATAALAGAEIADDLTYNPLNAPGAGTYPITAPTYLLVKPSYDATKGPLVKGFITWLLTDGQNLANGEGYAKLPASLQQKALAKLDSVKVG